ncbi:hypothetical protein Lspi_2348 [Legionella spiritensis]|uniref:Uncharacterized protein n=2 Tax=Legionella spiritensis TaxID=452 RepID=A0A0W0YYY1_LEGSP|nr:hypothetical protein Lspi_2348 [Legionella spiritensis]SNV38783.1 Uncharacterised protein [Legionella spiritensis]
MLASLTTMSENKTFTNITIETLVLVAVWERPFVFQGCFKITRTGAIHSVLLFFRCECLTPDQSDTINPDFSPHDYRFTHLYNATHPVRPDPAIQSVNHALYLLKYALHATLTEMHKSQTQRFMSIDAVAMQAMIRRVEPILKGEVKWTGAEEELGFAASMDFSPQEVMGEMAANTLLKCFNHPDNGLPGTH